MKNDGIVLHIIKIMIMTLGLKAIIYQDDIFHNKEEPCSYCAPIASLLGSDYLRSNKAYCCSQIIITNFAFLNHESRLNCAIHLGRGTA